ncbi:MAG: polysaccharide deacetylase family protein [Candidatus Improbicoccus devescovinae]|nr:MAG: polysaccharide deacetylase family protein [Candidatus Improbicoccus devescovinae]
MIKIKFYIKNYVIKYIFLCIFIIISLIVISCFIPLSDKNYIMAAEGTQETVSLPILMYHGLVKSSDKSKNKYNISTELFEEDLAFIKKNEFNTIIMEDLINHVNNNIELPRNPIMITFDDGYLNNYINGFPLIQKYNTKIVFAPIGSCIEKYSNCNERDLSYCHCTWDDLKIMKDSNLVDIQNHSYDMHTNTSRHGCKILKCESKENYRKILTKDLLKFQEIMYNHLNITPSTFVYPFGALCPECDEILLELGFKATLSCYGRINHISKDPKCLYRLCRILRPPNIKPDVFFKKHKII